MILIGNTLYGTTAVGGANGAGTLFSLAPNPIISLSAGAPTAFGSQVGTLAITGSSGSYNTANASFASTSTGYLAVSAFNPSTDAEVYALNVTDSVAANLSTDLADAVSEINLATYTGYTVTASTNDPLAILSNGYNFYITITSSALGTDSPYFGFDFSQLNGTTDTLTVSSIAVVPEPISLTLISIGCFALLRRRCRCV